MQRILFHSWKLLYHLDYPIIFFKRLGISTIYTVDPTNLKKLFPKLLVGPIERAGHLLPQLSKNIYFDQENIIEGGRRIAWGLFKKLVVADRISIYQRVVINNLQEQSGITILFASLIYTFQVYADFSGYTDIAIGTARLFGF